ncbi:MAG: ECF-type sigma factor [Acidobacteriota bacterium]
MLNPQSRLVAVNPDADLTGLLQAWSRGDEGALPELAPLVHRELRGIARRLLAGERNAGAWQPTDLLQEPYVRPLDWRTAHGPLAEPSALLLDDRAHDASRAAGTFRRPRRTRLDIGMGDQPLLDGLGGMLIQYVDHGVAFQIDHDRAVGVPFAFGPLIDADHPSVRADGLGAPFHHRKRVSLLTGSPIRRANRSPGRPPSA